MGSPPGSFSCCSARQPLNVPSVSDEVVCFQGDRGPKGTCGGDGPKGEKVGFVRDKMQFSGRSSGDVNDETVCDERFLRFYSVIITTTVPCSPE